MTAAEARLATQKFNSNLEESWALLYEIRERRGWEALGYPNFAAYVRSELRLAKTHAYQLADAGGVAKTLSAISGKVDHETHARELAKAGGVNVLRVYREAERTAAGGKLTQRHIRETVERMGLGPKKWGARVDAGKAGERAAAMLKMSSEQLARMLLRLVRQDQIPHRLLDREIEFERGMTRGEQAADLRVSAEFLRDAAEGKL